MSTAPHSSPAAGYARGPGTGFERVVAALEARGYGPIRNGNARCPAHDDRTPSLSVSKGERGALLRCFAGCTVEEVLRALGLDMTAIFDEALKHETRSKRANGHARPERVAEYVYSDRMGEPLARKVRFEPGFDERAKSFLWEVHGDAGWRKAKRGEGNPNVLYNLPLIVEADQVHVCEGEKAADALVRLGLVATCAPATAWQDTFTAALRGKRITLWADRDGSGETQARAAFDSLRKAGISIEAVRARVEAAHADAFDHLAAGFAPDQAEPFTFDDSSNRGNGAASEADDLGAGGPEPEAPAASDRLCFLSDYQAERVEWLWKGRIPVGKLTVADGDPDLGKSTVLIDLAARLSTGRAMPDGSPGLEHPVKTLLLAAEDGIADTVLPRLIAAGGDPTQVLVLEAIATETGIRPPSLIADLMRIEQHIREHDVKLLVIDPLMAFLCGAESNAAQDMAEALAGLKGVLERTGCGCVALRHLNKGGGGKALYRGLNSVQIIAAARSALYFERHPDDPDRIVLAVAKCNLAPPGDRESLAYRIVSTSVEDPAGGPPIPVGKIEWLGTVDFTANDLARSADQKEPSPKTAACMEAMRELLAGGTVEAKRGEDDLKKRGFSESVIKQAKKLLGVKSVKQDFGAGWWWATPEQAQKLAEVGA